MSSSATMNKPMQVQGVQGQYKLPVLVESMNGCAVTRRKSAASEKVPTKNTLQLPSAAVSAGGASPGASPRSGGSGFGGSRTPADDFAEGVRRSRWCRDDGELQAMPPRIYVDNKTLIRQVQDFTKLKRGDHCVTAINFVRATTPFADFVVSWLGSIEICYLYHHFIVLDDVDHVDSFGVPRTAEGNMAMIVEWGNTLGEAYTEVTTTAGGKLHSLPVTAMQFLLTDKAKFTKHPLADYGDTPHIYLVLEHKTAAEREKTVAQALDMFCQEKAPYNILVNNCEHAANKIKSGSHSSAQISFVCWITFRLVMGVVGLLVLKANQDWSLLADSCYGDLCSGHSRYAMALYHLFASVPVGLQAMISYVLLSRSVLLQHRQALIDRHECYHLLGKELGRTIVVGGWAVSAVALAPSFVSYFLIRLVVCALAYMVSDMIYNLCAHAVMRLVLLPKYGRVWLLGSSDVPQSFCATSSKKKVQ